MKIIKLTNVGVDLTDTAKLGVKYFDSLDPFEVINHIVEIVNEQKNILTPKIVMENYNHQLGVDDLESFKKEFLGRPINQQEAGSLCELNHCKFGIVGYNPSSFYIAYEDVDEGYIDDLYEGRDWYNMHLVKSNGDIVDSVYSSYIYSEDVLREYVLDYFGEKDFYLVENDCSEHFLEIPRVKKIKHVSYTYEKQEMKPNLPNKSKVKVNGEEVQGEEFAYDGCHKIYVIESEKDKEEAMKLGYEIHPIEKLKEAYDSSCDLRFIETWKLDRTYISQFEKAVFNCF